MYPSTKTLTFTKAGKILLGMAAVTTLGFVVGCMRAAYQTDAKTADSKSTNTLGNLKQTIDSIPKNSVKLTGTFIQGLEQSEFDDGTTKYHVFDPQGLLAKKAESLGQTGMALKFEVCIEGRVSEKGSYGHLGKYPYELEVDKIC